MENSSDRKASKTTNIIDLLGLIAWLFVLPTGLYICGQMSPALFLEKSLGPFGTPATLLLVFIGLTFFRTLFGSAKRALPILSGLLVGLAFFASTFDFPYLAFIHAAMARFPAFSEPGPAFFAGLASIAVGMILGQFEKGHGVIKFFSPPALAIAILLVLSGLKPFPHVEAKTLSMDSAFSEIAKTLGYQYRNPEVDAAVSKVVEEKDKTVAEKERMIAELTSRLQKSEEDRAALKKSADDAARLGSELDEAKKTLNELKGKIDGDTPLVQGGDYDKAIQPSNPGVRDFAVKIAKSYPGAFDDPQGSKLPSEAGLHQAVLVHGSISSSWKYVSDPSVDWALYVSPARRTLAVGLAGNCADFAVFVASCIEAVGGRARIMHGFTSSAGHAWAELWLGQGARAQADIQSIAALSGRSPSAIAIDHDESGGQWLVLDWRLGEYTLHSDRTVVAWTGGK